MIDLNKLNCGVLLIFFFLKFVLFLKEITVTKKTKPHFKINVNVAAQGKLTV
jgi:hypothetical protein